MINMVSRRSSGTRKNSMNSENRLTCSGNDSKRRKDKQFDQQRVFMTENDYRMRLQEVLYTPEHILTKVFRKDGPLLGARFDSLPSNSFSRGSRMYPHDKNRSDFRAGKGTIHASLDSQVCGGNSSLVQRHGAGKGPITAKGAFRKRHGMGKCLMTVHQFTNLDPSDFPWAVKFSENTIQKKKKKLLPQQSIVRKLAIKEKAKKKTSRRSRKVECQKVHKQNHLHEEKCFLALEEVKCLENAEPSASLVDDEELELQELQAGLNPLSCSAHISINGSNRCSLCKDLLAKFPPNSVKMTMPLHMQPWASSSELLKKIFKVFHFLCTYAVTINIYPFTLDDFTHAFHDKDSLLLGQVHLALLKLLLNDVKKELGRRFLFHASKNCKFSALLHSLERRTSVLELWQKSLNLLTWTEILCQVMIASGFGLKLDLARKETCSKEVNLMEKYSLSPGTLKGELFSILLTQGNNGMKVSELAKSSSIAELNLTDEFCDLENLITLSLSGDMTLFEKISSSGYRLRINAVAKECEDYSSGSEDFGCVDDTSEVSIECHKESDFECASKGSSPLELDACGYQSDMLTVCNEIDESYPGEVWLLGLVEGEYSNLNIDEKLSALASLIDVVSAGSTIRMEDPLTTISECSTNIHYGFGAKVKRATTPRPIGHSVVQSLGNYDINASEQPVDSLFPTSKVSVEEKHANLKKLAEEVEAECCLHSMQSIFLGSDRRYNRYWLFLGPCDELDPGHRRIYFESSEDGHWEVIDTPESLCSLMLALDRRGVREAQLLASLEKREAFLSQAMASLHNLGNIKLVQFDQSEHNISREASTSPISDVDNRLCSSEISKNLTSSRLPAVEPGLKLEQNEKSSYPKTFDACLWKSFYNELHAVKNRKKAYFDSLRRCDSCHDLYWRDEKHCRICHTTFELGFDLEEKYAIHSALCQINGDSNKSHQRRILSSQLQVLKASIYAIELVVPEDGLLGSWRKSAHNLWVNRLRRASNLAEFLQVLADFVSALNEDWFSKNTITSGSFCVQNCIFSDFSTVPHTFSAVALWLVKLDFLIDSHTESCNSQCI